MLSIAKETVDTITPGDMFPYLALISEVHDERHYQAPPQSRFRAEYGGRQ